MTSKATVLMVVGFLGIFALAALAGTVFLIDSNAPSTSVAIITGPMGVALGALASMLVSSRSTLGKNDIEPTMVQGMVPVAPAGPASVVVANQPGDPVPVAEVVSPPQGP